jgi:signal transduction histidine kinase
MKTFGQQLLDRVSRLLVTPGPEPEQQAARMLQLERNIVLPVKAVFILTLGYYFFYLRAADHPAEVRLYFLHGEAAFEWVRSSFVVYAVINLAAAALFVSARRIPLHFLQWIVFTLALVDGFMLAALTVVTGGFDSTIYWIFLLLILRNAISLALATPQIAVNLAVCFLYIIAGVVDVAMSAQDLETLELDPGTQQALGYEDNPAEPFFLRVVVLLLWTMSCYGLQVLFEKQRLAEEEAKEFSAREDQLHTAGRLAAEIAHQIKNPLGIINNAAYSLQRLVAEQDAAVREQAGIIREEVDRADRIITELMGYAQLAEGKVERVDVKEELDRAIAEVFPPGAKFNVQVRREYAVVLPPLLMQRAHLSEIFVNILQNAREALNGCGQVEVTAHYGEDYSVIISIADNGPGIPPDKMEKVFEPYFTTKEKGTGLGLAIVRHNVEMYGGTLELESALGRGTRFILHLRAKSLMRLRK